MSNEFFFFLFEKVEIGDAQIVLSYSSEQKKLNVMIKTVKISSSNLLDHLTGNLLLLLLFYAL